MTTSCVNAKATWAVLAERGWSVKRLDRKSFNINRPSRMSRLRRHFPSCSAVSENPGYVKLWRKFQVFMAFFVKAFHNTPLDLPPEGAARCGAAFRFNPVSLLSRPKYFLPSSFFFHSHQQILSLARVAYYYYC